MELENIQIKEVALFPVKLTRDEKKKLKVIKRLINKEFNGTKAAQMLKVTTRQIRNLKRQVLNEGDAGIIHKNRYNKPANTYDEETRVKIDVQSRSTIYNILREQHIRSPQRKKHKRAKKEDK